MRITAPHYVAGIVWEVDIVDYGKFKTVGQALKIVKAAPIVTWATRRQISFEWALNYFKKKGFVIELFEIPHRTQGGLNEPNAATASVPF